MHVKKSAFLLLILVLGTACLATDQAQLTAASAEWKQNKGYASLEVIVAAHFRNGMPRKEVERLLGPEDYAPGEGSAVYYSSDKQGPLGDTGSIATYGLVVEYMERNAPYTVTDRLQRWILGPVGE